MKTPPGLHRWRKVAEPVLLQATHPSTTQFPYVSVIANISRSGQGQPTLPICRVSAASFPDSAR